MRSKLDDIRNWLVIALTTLAFEIATKEYRAEVAENLMLGTKISEAKRKGLVHPAYLAMLVGGDEDE